MFCEEGLLLHWPPESSGWKVEVRPGLSLLPTRWGPRKVGDGFLGFPSPSQQPKIILLFLQCLGKSGQL